MFSSVHRCTGDLTCEVLILTCFGNLPPDRQVYLGMGTIIVKETIRGGRRTYRRVGGGACRRRRRRIGLGPYADARDLRMISREAPFYADTPLRRPADPSPLRPVSPLVRELNSPFISHGVSRVRTSHLAQIDSDPYLSP